MRHTALLATILSSTSIAVAQLPLRYTVDSPRDRPTFTAAAALLGDVDGDGVPDFAISDTTGAPFTEVDEVQVFSGATGALLSATAGTDSDQNYGASLAGVGDIDGDGVPDMLVGAPGDDSFGSGSGKAFVVAGSDGSVLFTFAGTANFHGCGSAVAAPEDLDGDGTPDLLIAFGGEDLPTLANGGAVRAFSGATGAVLLVLGNTGDPSEGFAAAISGAGDLDGDGVPDLLIGVPGRLDRTVAGVFGRYGSVEARSGADGTILFELADRRAEVIFNFGFGRSVAGGTDLNGDGRPEILVGAPGAADAVTGVRVGSLLVYDGATQALIAQHFGDERGPGSLGHHATFVGDVNADGVDDYAAAYDYTGTVGYSGYVRVYSGATHALLDELQGLAAFDGFGSALVALGDIDGDLLPDLLVGARQGREAHVMSVAGARAYGVDLEPTQTLDLTWSPEAGADAARGRLQCVGAAPNAAGVIFGSTRALLADFLGATILVDVGFATGFAVPLTFDANGSFVSSVTTLREAGLDGIVIHCQLLAIDAASPIGFVSSNGIELRLTD